MMADMVPCAVYYVEEHKRRLFGLLHYWGESSIYTRSDTPAQAIATWNKAQEILRAERGDHLRNTGGKT